VAFAIQLVAEIAIDQVKRSPLLFVPSRDEDERVGLHRVRQGSVDGVIFQGDEIDGRAVLQELNARV
jgi:hypothetical protein